MTEYSEEEFKKNERDKRKRNLMKVLDYGERIRNLKFKRPKEDLTEKIDDALLSMTSEDILKDDLIYKIDPEDREEAEKIIKFFENEYLLKIKDGRVKMIDDLRKLYGFQEEKTEDEPVPAGKRMSGLRKDEVSIASSTYEQHSLRKKKSRALFGWFLACSLILAIFVSYSKVKVHVDYAIKYWKNKKEEIVSAMFLKKELERREHETAGERYAIRFKKMLEKYTTEQHNVEKGSETVK